MTYTRKIMYISGLLFFTAVLFLGISLQYIIPSFNNLIVESTEKEIVLATQFLSIVVNPDELSLESVTDEAKELVDTQKTHFAYEKIKIFSPDGRVIYSTNIKDIGTVNKNNYFHKNVASGEIYSKQVKKNTETLEGRVIETDVLETYVPAMDGSRFLGAYEIYYDMTARNNEMGRIATRYTLISLLLILTVVILSLLVMMKEDGLISQDNPTFLEKVYESPIILLLIVLSSLFIVEMIIMNVISYFPELFSTVGALLDSLLLVMFMIPVFYIFLVRPMLYHIEKRSSTEKSLRNASTILDENLEAATASYNKRIVELEKQIKDSEQSE
ncbi:MAG: hypothetical protein ISR97_04670 [Nitrospira sp.]|nr:hypothetical protein [Nitrospira sp.]